MNLKSWYSKNKLDKETRQILLKPQVERENNTNLQEYQELKKQLNIKDLENYNLNLGKDARSLIKQLFNEYVDVTTLVITSGLEHESVNEILGTVKNKYVLDEYRLTHLDIVEKELSEILPKYNKVFLYMIGVHMSTGFIMPDKIFDTLKALFKDKQMICVLDDVHGLFSVNRNRTKFDYIIGTTHALIDGFNTGLLFSKQDKKEFGYKSTNQLSSLVEKLNILRQNTGFYDLRESTKVSTEKAFVVLPGFEYVGNIIAYYLPQELSIEKIKQVIDLKDESIIKFAGDKRPYFSLRSQELLFLSEDEFDKVNEKIEKLFSLISCQ